jgi:NAD(P)-dependent dehydrogenase (short-subunit alcohol dehydrogenase family)
MKIKLKPIDQQVVVVVGANSGIGRATALLFGEKGARVVVSGRSKDELESLAGEIRRNGGQAIAMTADVADFQQMKGLADRVAETHGRIDTWVHCAAVMLYAAFEQTSPEEFRRVTDVNLLGQIYGAKAAIPHIKDSGGGALIHVSSVEGRRSLPYQSAYAASKFGVTAFLDALRMELTEAGIPISVTNVKPSGVNTPLYDKALTKLGVKPRPIPPIYQPEAVAWAILQAAARPMRDITVGGAGRSLVIANRLSPRLGDAVLMRLAFKGQRTDQPKSEHSRNNLYQHLEGFDQVEGPFTDETKPSAYTRLAAMPLLALGLGAVAIVGLVFVGGRMLRSHT